MQGFICQFTMDRKSASQCREKTYVFLWSRSQFQQEQTEWDAVNRLLQRHGFKPVRFADPTENKNLSDLVLLEKTSSSQLRVMINTMLVDSERRQALIQELLQSNSKLKQEVEQQQVRAVRQSHRAEELEAVLTGVKVKVQELEDSIINKAAQQQGKLQQLQRDKNNAEMRCQTLQQQFSEQVSRVCELQKKLHVNVKEEEKSEAPQQFFRPSARQHSSTDQLCSVCKSDLSDSQTTTASTSCSYKTLLKEHLKRTNTQHEDLKSEVQLLRQELNCRLTQSETAKHPETSSSDTQPHHDEYQKCISILSDIMVVMTNPRAPLGLQRKPDTGGGLDLEQMVPTLELWRQQLSALPELQRSVRRLVRRLLPWQPEESACPQSDCVKVEDVMRTVDTLLDGTAAPENEMLCTPTKSTMQAMVSHFQMLFDVPSLRGVYPRMNEIYTRLAEMNNSMRNLRDVLQLDEGSSPGDVVNMVARIMTRVSSYHNTQELLDTGDIDSIIMKLREHQEFFPAFHSLVTNLLNTLGAESLDEILPRVQSLKLTD